MSRCFRLLAAIALLSVGIVSVSVAQKDDTVFTCNKIAVTCEGMSNTDFVFGIMSLTGIAGAPIGDNWTTPATTGDHGVGTMQYTRQNMGQLFGIANEKRGVYVTATAIYDTWNQAWGTIN